MSDNLNLNPPDFYQILGVAQTDSFPALKRAYYRRAKECHPDLFPGMPEKEEEFKRLVAAFDVLSDPRQRQAYDARMFPMQIGGLTAAENALHFGFNEEAILDSLADDALEELIVGNVIPGNATLQTLMLDLSRTEQFCLFREAKYYFYSREIHKALAGFKQAVQGSPHNILYHYFLAKCYCLLGQWALGAKELETGIKLGSLRHPALHLIRFHRELAEISQKHQGLIVRWYQRLTRPALLAGETEEEKSRRLLHREMNRLELEARKKRNLLK